MRIGLIFTNDWEIFGDGSGDFWEIQYKPMKQILDLMAEHNAKMTIMAEVGQQFGFKTISTINKDALKISDAWEELITNALIDGHDVQLHFHPQWLYASYNDEKWLLNNNKWAIGKLQENEIRRILTQGKEYLESLLQKVKSDYKCNCFRAGAYYIEPSENVIKVLRELEFICDTSVTKGLISDNYFDYSNAYSNVLPYFIGNDIKFKSEADENLIELPIYSDISINSNALKKFFPKIYSILRYKSLIPDDEIEWAKERDRLKNIRYPKENRFYKQNQKKDFKFYFSQIIGKQAQQLDYDYIYPTEFIKIIKNIYNSPDLKKIKNKDLILPVVASGHVKDIPNTYNIEKIIKLLKNEFGSDIVFLTLTDAVNYFQINKEHFTKN